MILEYSPIHHKERIDIPCTILCGEFELEELKWQSQNYFESKKDQEQGEYLLHLFLTLITIRF